MSSMGDNVAARLSRGHPREYVDGVIAGWHDFAAALGVPGGVASREELESSRHRMKFLVQLPHEWNDEQRTNWVDGYIDGYKGCRY